LIDGLSKAQVQQSQTETLNYKELKNSIDVRKPSAQLPITLTKNIFIVESSIEVISTKVVGSSGNIMTPSTAPANYYDGGTL